MQKFVYVDSLAGDGTAGNPYRAAHRDSHATQDENYQRHYLLQGHTLLADWFGMDDGAVLIASTVRIPTYEDLAEDPDAEVYEPTDEQLEALTEAGVPHHTPHELAEMRGTTREEMGPSDTDSDDTEADTAGDTESDTDDADTDDGESA